MKYNTRLTYKIYWNHVKRYKASGLVSFIGIAAGTILNLVPPVYYKLFFDLISQPMYGPELAPQLTRLIFIILGVHCVAWVFWRIAEFTNSYFQTKVMAALADTCFKHLQKHSHSFFENNFVGSLVKRVNRFYGAFEAISDKYQWDIWPLAINIIFITTVLFFKKPVLGISIMAWMIVFFAINYYYSIFKLKYDVKRSRLDTKTTGILADSITNYSNVNLFNGFSREVKLFGDSTNDLQRMRRLTWDLGGIMNALQALLMIGLEFVLFFMAVSLWKKGVLTIGDFVLIQAYILVIFGKLWNFGRVIRDLYERLADAEEMTVILETPHEIKDARGSKDLAVKKGEVEFNNVRFNYQKTKSIIKDFNLKIKGGERVALVGPSGTGKSTIVKLLLRVNDLTRGDILIDGQNIKNVTQKSLHNAISMVPQDPILFHRTLMENIKYGNPEASNEEVIMAAKAAHCHEFIIQSPDGYKTYVGERGVKLSGGERQRAAIARAILRNAPILILDEATSSLDSESEALIQDALEKLMKGKTVIVIAHRLSTIMKMDRILVIDEGKITEQGSHKELAIKKGGLYSALWERQAGGFVE